MTSCHIDRRLVAPLLRCASEASDSMQLHFQIATKRMLQPSPLQALVMGAARSNELFGTSSMLRETAIANNVAWHGRVNLFQWLSPASKLHVGISLSVNRVVQKAIKFARA
jgi:hypothetical protein